MQPFTKVHINFNSHAHVERDLFVKQNMELCKISTHTLTWSVTNFHNNTFRNAKISTHTLTWSVTGLPYSENAGKHISTHTLTWSVTLIDQYAHVFLTFQLTRSRGA